MYTPVDSRVWNDEKFVQFSPSAKLLFLYFLTSPHRNIVGLYYLPRGYVTEDVKLPEKELSSAWNELIKSGRIAYDEQARVVFVTNFLRFNPIKGDKSMKGAANYFAKVPKTPLAASLLEVVSMHYDEEEAMPLIEAIRQKIGNEKSPSDTPSMGDGKPHGSSISNNNSNNQEQETPPPASGGDADLQTKRFDEFWSLYPKKTAKKEARKSWDRVKPNAALFEKILKAVKCAAQSEQWQRENGRFIPNPATWLNQGRWDDEMPQVIGGERNVEVGQGHSPPAYNPDGNRKFRSALDEPWGDSEGERRPDDE